MGLTRHDKEQLLQLGGMLLPVGLELWKYAQSQPAKTQEAKANLEKTTLDNIKTVAEITKLNKGNDQPEPNAIPLAAANNIVRQFSPGADVSNLAGPDGKIHPKLFNTLINAYSQATSVGIRKEEVARGTRKDIAAASKTELDEVQDQIKRAQTILGADPPLLSGREALSLFKQEQLKAAAALPALHKKAIVLEEQRGGKPQSDKTPAVPDLEDMGNIDEVIKRNNFTPEKLKEIIQRINRAPDKKKAESDLVESYGIDSDTLFKIANQYDKFGIPAPK